VLLAERMNVEVLSAMTKTQYMVILMKYGMCSDTHVLTDRAEWFVVFIKNCTRGRCQKSILFYA